MAAQELRESSGTDLSPFAPRTPPSILGIHCLTQQPDSYQVRSRSNTLARKVNLRASHIKAPSLSTMSTQSTPARTMTSDYANPTWLSHNNGRVRDRRQRSEDFSILKEISNSSMRRQKTKEDMRLEQSYLSEHNVYSPTQDINAPLEQENVPHGPPETCCEQLPRKLRYGSIGKAHSKDGNGARPRKRSSVASTGRRVTSGSNTKYIEHLESQLAAIQTQLQSLTSPSVTKTQSAKLRAMTSETQLLREEVKAWEERFEERLQDQLEQQQVVIRELRSHIKTLERSATTTCDRIEELQIELERKDRQLTATERANVELERRLEFFSDMLATSPSISEQHRYSSTTQRLTPTTRTPDNYFSGILHPVNHESAFPSARNIQGLGTPLDDQHAIPPSDVPEKPAAGHSSNFSLSSLATDAESVASGVTLVGTSVTSPVSRRSSLFSGPGGDSSRPTRRMRRFHTGTTGPRTLILPNTANISGLPASAPVSAVPNLWPSSKRNSICEPPGLWAHAELHSGPTCDSRQPSLTTQPLQEKGDGHSKSSPASQISQNPNDTATSRATDTSSVDSPSSNTSSLIQRSVHRRNLFEELSQLKHTSFSRSSGHIHNPTYLTSRPATAESTATITADCRTSTHQAPRSPTDFRRTIFAPPPSWSPAFLVQRLSTIFSQSLNGPSSLITRPFTIVALSRPVVEFRLWLVRILVGDLWKKQRMRKRLSAATLGLCYGEGDAASEEEQIVTGRVFSTDPGLPTVEEYPSAPGPTHSTWLKFGMVVLFAVGVAIKDGPGPLFQYSIR